MVQISGCGKSRLISENDWCLRPDRSSGYPPQSVFIAQQMQNLKSVSLFQSDLLSSPLLLIVLFCFLSDWDCFFAFRDSTIDHFHLSSKNSALRSQLLRDTLFKTRVSSHNSYWVWWNEKKIRVKRISSSDLICRSPLELGQIIRLVGVLIDTHPKIITLGMTRDSDLWREEMPREQESFFHISTLDIFEEDDEEMDGWMDG